MADVVFQTYAPEVPSPGNAATIPENGQQGDGGGAGNPALQSVGTDTGTTPSATRITLGSSQNAVRVFADLVAASEPFFYLYVKRNSDSVQKVKIYAWSARIFSGAAGDTFAFSTADGRTLSMAAMTVPAVLETAIVMTPTPNSDRGVPPYWSPSIARVTLASAGSMFWLMDDSTSNVVFIKEFDGTNWTPPRWVRRQAGRNTAVRCTYRQIALATLDGSSLSIGLSSFSDSVSGAAAGAMTNPFMPVATGATHNVTNAATLQSAIALAVAGDEIVLATGTYTLTAAIGTTSFTANHLVNPGRVGPGGILFRSATGNPADVTITGNASGQNGRWLFEADNVSFCGFKGLTFDFTGIDARFDIQRGSIAFEDVRMTGVASVAQSMFLFGGQSGLGIIEALRLTVEDSSSDCFSGQGNASMGASRCRFVDCIGRRSDPSNQANQCLTTHNGLPVEWYGGLLSDAHTNVAAPDLITSPIYLFFPTVTKGAHTSGLQNCTIFGGDIDGFVGGQIGAEGGCLFAKISITPVGSNNIFRTPTARCEHNILSSTSAATGARACFTSNNSGNSDGFRYNVNSGFTEAYLEGFSSGPGGSAGTIGNTYITNTNAIGISDANIVSVCKNNACKGSSNGILCTATSMGNLTTDYNTIDPNIDADFVPGANDLVAGDAALDAFFFPTAAGNCDGNGDTTVEDFIGDSDPWGYVRVYKASRVSRGARDIPAIHASTYLQPDLF